MTCSFLAQMGKLIPSARGEPEPQALLSQSGTSGQVKNKALALRRRHLPIMRLYGICGSVFSKKVKCEHHQAAKPC
ncbi:hypothetical protein [Anabaena azotica]|uniref:Uncharacterized protein n=1 Tax=Anabaena azotica FACHB-119 TaxID=947527 RepID=A0ABR8D449_9NOST|nr:hypothetical protein [Anabaena azotica]MBD2501065.1 hypothetical protein [Anabaena azotica FACHB-119]